MLWGIPANIGVNFGKCLLIFEAAGSIGSLGVFSLLKIYGIMIFDADAKTVF